jgi:hypothetical protein
MDELIVVEVLDRAGRVTERVRLTSFPACIGRAYDCAVIIDDLYVSPHHLAIERDAEGKLCVVDTQSDNGIYLSADGRRVARTALADETGLRIGHTQLRLRRAGYAVTMTLIDQRNGDASGRSINRGRVLAALLLVSAVALFVQMSWNTYTQPKPAQLLFYVFVTIIMVLTWAGGWALASRVFAHRPAFFAHGVIATLALLAWMVYDILLEYYRFALAAELSADILNYAGAFALLSALFAAHLRFSSAHRPRPRLLISSAIAGILIGLGLLTHYVAGMEFTALPEFDGILKPPAFRISSSHNLDRFFTDARELQSMLAQLKADD